MAETDISDAELPGETDNGPDLSETVLRSEIAFWQEMIESHCDALPPEAVERMHHALSLAKWRLTGMCKTDLQNEAAKVIQLNSARRKVQ